MGKALKIGIPICIYIFFLLGICYVYHHPIKCPFSRDIGLLNDKELPLAQNEYIYNIDQCHVDEEDIFHLITISGWLLREEDGKYVKADADLVLQSKYETYRINIYDIKRTDVYYVDQSDPNTEDAYCGFLAHFPADEIAAGKYKIGFLVNENRTTSVFWTDSEVDIVA